MNTSLISLRNFHTNAKPNNLNGFNPNNSTPNIGVSYDTSNPNDPCIVLSSLSDHVDKFCTYTLGPLPAGSYVYAAYVGCQQQGLNVLRVVVRDGSGQYREIAHAKYTRMGVCKAPFTLVQPMSVMLRIQAPQVAGQSADYRRLIVCTAAAYEHLEQAYEHGELPYPWFDYATMPLDS